MVLVCLGSPTTTEPAVAILVQEPSDKQFKIIPAACSKSDLSPPFEAMSRFPNSMPTTDKQNVAADEEMPPAGQSPKPLPLGLEAKVDLAACGINIGEGRVAVSTQGRWKRRRVATDPQEISRLGLEADRLEDEWTRVYADDGVTLIGWFRSYYICLSGGDSWTCGSLMLSKSWTLKFKEDPLKAGRNGKAAAVTPSTKRRWACSWR